MRVPQSKLALFFVFLPSIFARQVDAQEAIQPESISLEQQLRDADLDRLALDVSRRGNPRQGAILFYMSAAGCVKCHESGANASPLGPNLAAIGTDITVQHVIESLLYPSKKISKGYATLNLLTDSGSVTSGLLVRESETEIVLRDASNLGQEIRVSVADIDERRVSTKSMMPEGLVATLRSQREFLDLASYVVAVAQGGQSKADELKPAPEQLVVKDDTQDLDHAKILRKLTEPKGYEKGKAIYNGLCNSCHGVDGNTPSLATARAFGTQKLKFGSDPYSMFLTLSRGNGLMAATTYLSPMERYQVVQYIREKFMKDSNPDYRPIDDEYLNGLPKGKELGDFKPSGDRDYGPALASQLGRNIGSSLTVKLGSTTLSYNLHTLDQADIWQGGFLDLNQTQHQRGRGEGVPKPVGNDLAGLDGWRWGHDKTLDYSRQDLLPRGPMPSKWLEYRGHYLHDDELVLSYKIDGREILELPSELPGSSAVRRALKIGPGDRLVLAAAQGRKSRNMVQGIVEVGKARPSKSDGPAGSTIALSGELMSRSLGSFSAAKVLGDADGLTWTVDSERRLVLQIPADTKDRNIEIICFSGQGESDLRKLEGIAGSSRDLSELIRGGPARWPDVLTTVGYLGLEQGAYAFDTISLPEKTPWNTWFRTSALDFFPDGRLVVTTTGGDVWIASGVDDDLLELKWKRFAGGLYEPFGVKVVDGMIYVICKDRLTRLHDFNGDGEADFYESFHADDDVSTFFHAFNFDLHTDADGNFYYAKCGQYTSYALPGAIVQVSPDGKQRSIYCTGFRTPNGMGMLPDGRMTVSDNQGTWMPASKISLVKRNGFYGYVQNHSGGEGWAPDGGRIDHKKIIPPKTFDQPIIWMPQEVDNSSGGQVWVDDPRFGPIAGRLMHTSFGKGWLYYLMIQEVDGITQAAIVKLPHDFSTGIMRGRVNRRDGQVYVTGMNGWNENGRPGLKDHGIERVRYTGKPMRMITDCQVQPDGLKLNFSFAVDEKTASDVSSYVISQWNYHWTGNYGSEAYHPESDKVGKQSVEINSAKVSPDRLSVLLQIPSIRPVNQLHLRLNIKDASSNTFSEEVYWTIHRVPKG